MAHITRREFLELGAAGLACVASGCRTAGPTGARRGLAGPAIAPFALQEATVADLQEGMESGKYTAHALCEYYLARIEDLDGRGPTLRSVIETNPDALRIARELDAERKTKGPRGPLHGIPILIKDNIATADRMATTAGSLALVGARPRADAGVAARLRAAGAVMLGKANLSEWANFRSNSSSSGWSARGGQCKNPYVLDRSPCGSSSGTAAALAANFAAVGVGTETDGSIVCPAAACSLVGIKPTLGLVSRTGIVPIAHSQDTAGPMTRTVLDAAIPVGALVGPDPKDPPTAAAPAAVSDFTRFLDAKGLAGARPLASRNRVKSETAAGAAAVAASLGSGPARAPSRIAASRTVRAIGPAVSWLWAIGTMPVRETRPSVGLIPTSEHAAAGQTIEPSVSVPTPTAAKFAASAAAVPELEPQGLRSSTYGFLHWPPRALHPLEELLDRKF